MACRCSICTVAVDGENAAILAMGGFGNPRYMCEGCALDFDELTLERDPDVITEAKSRIAKKMTDAALDDALTLRTIEGIMAKAEERLAGIKEGTYDFTDEDAAAACAEDEGVPEELRETEEDRELERQREKKYEKIDKITNWICIGAIIAFVGFVVYRMFFA